jgi:hypothetical protein
MKSDGTISQKSFHGRKGGRALPTADDAQLP